MRRQPKHIRLIVDEAKRLAAAAGVGCRFYRTKPASGHATLIFQHGGRKRRKPLASSPTNPETSRVKALSDIRRILRDLTA